MSFDVDHAPWKGVDGGDETVDGGDWDSVCWNVVVTLFGKVVIDPLA